MMDSLTKRGLAGSDLSAQEVADFIAGDMSERRPGLTLEQATTMVSLARRYIERDPTRFLDSYLDNINALAQQKAQA